MSQFFFFCQPLLTEGVPQRLPRFLVATPIASIHNDWIPKKSHRKSRQVFKGLCTRKWNQSENIWLIREFICIANAVNMKEQPEFAPFVSVIPHNGYDILKCVHNTSGFTGTNNLHVEWCFLYYAVRFFFFTYNIIIKICF